MNEIDWNLRNFEIMQQTGWTAQRTSRERVKSGHKGNFRRGKISLSIKRPGSTAGAKIDPDKVDWTKSYSDIGKEFGVTRQAAQSLHKRLQQFENQ